MGKFAAQSVVVTGGASGLGEETVRSIVAEGGRAVIADLQEERGRALAPALGASAISSYRCDAGGGYRRSD